ncbi:MAG: magnesium transporter CorA family protein [Patescibacteria group bacterium]
MKNIREVQLNNYRWIDIVNFGPEEREYLAKNFSFQELDLKDCLSPTQRPKVEKYPGYAFLILLFPVYNRQNRQIYPSEVDFFIGQNYLITVHRNELAPLIDLLNVCQTNQDEKEACLAQGPVHMLYHVINKLLVHCFPMLDHISLGISNVKKSIFQASERRMVGEILLIRQNIADLRKIMQAHKNTIQKLLGRRDGKPNHVIPNKLQTHFDNIINLDKDIWDNLESFREAIETLQQTNESLISNRLNEIMKLLTMISVILLPITLIASIFGMNTRHMPFIGQPYDFWVIIGMSAFIVMMMVLYFRKKRWI